MKKISCLVVLTFIFVTLSCSSEPPESPDGRYGKSIPDKTDALAVSDILPRQGQYLNRDVVIYGEIINIDSLQGGWFDLKSGDDIIRCTIRDFGLPQALIGRKAWVFGELKLIQVASEGGRDIGGGHTFAADPSSARYHDQLRIQTKGVEIDFAAPVH